MKGPPSIIPLTKIAAVATDKDFYVAYSNASDNKISIIVSHDNGDNSRFISIENTTNKQVISMAAVNNYVYLLLNQNQLIV